jgi:hypothetical protein
LEQPRHVSLPGIAAKSRLKPSRNQSVDQSILNSSYAATAGIDGSVIFLIIIRNREISGPTPAIVTMPLYQRLKSTESEIRLLILNPGECDAEIECSFQVASLDVSCEFEALSYVWGDMSNLQPIIVDDTKFEVTVNLAAALRRVRHIQQPRILWVDAICINQNDPEEKNTQIPLMGRIYTTASTVLVWLGEADHESMRLAISWIQTYVTKEITSPYSYWLALDTKALASDAAMREKYLATQKTYLGSLNFKVNPYWTRMWTFQEFKLPLEEPLCINGPISFRASLLIEGSQALLSASLEKLPPQAEKLHSESPSRLGSADMPMRTDERGGSLQSTDNHESLRTERQTAQSQFDQASREMGLASAEFELAQREDRSSEEVKELAKRVVGRGKELRKSGRKLSNILREESKILREKHRLEREEYRLEREEYRLRKQKAEFSKSESRLSSLIRDRLGQVVNADSHIHRARRFPNSDPRLDVSTDLLGLLMDTRTRHCFDPRDRVYALHELLSDPTERHPPDYNKPVLQVMQETTVTILNTPGDRFFALTAFPLRSERFIDTAYASWVLDLSSMKAHYNDFRFMSTLLCNVAGTNNYADAESGILHIGARRLGNCVVYARFDSDEENIPMKLSAVLRDCDLSDNSGTMTRRQLRVFYTEQGLGHEPTSSELDYIVLAFGQLAVKKEGDSEPQGTMRLIADQVTGKALIKAGGRLGICSNDVRDEDVVVLPPCLGRPLVLRREQT